MRILVFSEVFWPEDFIINDLVREWVRMGHGVEVVTQYPSYPASYVFDGYTNKGCRDEDWEGVTIHRFPFVEGYRDKKLNKFRNYFRFVRGGKRVVDSLKGSYDCVFVSQTGPMTVIYPALYAKRKLGVPVNVWTCDLWPDVVWAYGAPRNAMTEWLLDGMIGRLFGGCDRIFISSRRFAETIGRYTSKECVYAPNWVKPVQPVESDLRLEKGKVHFLFAGNVSRYQNLLNTVEGFSRAKLEDAQLNIVGDGSYLQEVMDHTARIGAKNVVFYGRRPYNEIPDILRQCDVLVLPLMPDEGIEKTEPYKIQAYLQAGKPILGVLNGAGRDIIEENDLGLCVNPTDVEAIALGFRKMADYGQRQGEEVAKRAGELMEKRFKKEEIVDRITRNLVRR